MIGRLMNLRRDVFNSFRKSERYQSLKRIELLRKTKLMMGKALWKIAPHNPKLHDDPVLQRAFMLIGKEINPTSIIETGTFLGSSTGYIAQRFPEVKIYTSEINEQNFLKARNNLRKYPNVKQFKGTSPVTLRQLYEKNIPGKRPLFFLDAHWLDDWPLEEEMEIITNQKGSALIIIDDFKVPDDPRYGYDSYGPKECSLELILPHMNPKNSYHVLFPKYGEKEIFSKNQAHYNLVGYPLIFQNMDDFFKKISAHPFIQKYFVDRSDLLKFPKKSKKK